MSSKIVTLSPKRSKNEDLAAKMMEIIAEEEWNDTYGRERMHKALELKYYTIEQLKLMIWRYFMSYWNNRRICSGNNGFPPAEKRQRYYTALSQVA